MTVTARTSTTATLGAFVQAFLGAHPVEAARALERCSIEQLQAVTDGAPASLVARCLAHMVPAVAAELLGQVTLERAAQIVQLLQIPASARLVKRLSKARRADLFDVLPGGFSAPLRIALRFAANTVGARVDPHIVVLRPEMTVEDAVVLARRDPRLLKKYLYVTDDQNRLAGVIDVRQCLLAAVRETPVVSLAERQVVSLRARASALKASADAGWQRFAILPVVDRDGVLLGVVRARDLRDAARDEAGQHPSAGLMATALDVAELYWDTSAKLFLPARPSATDERDV